MDNSYQFRKLKNVSDIPFEDKFLRIFYPVEKNNLDLSISRYFEKILSYDFVLPYAALMPDFHPGDKNVIGSVIPTKGMILINEIGGDIGCGMMFYPLGVHFKEIKGSLQSIYNELLSAIPTGSSLNIDVNKRVKSLAVFNKELKAKIMSNSLRKKVQQQMGSLGGGNHFLEIQVDEHEHVCIMVHSGSRFLGVKIRDYYIKKYQELCNSGEKINFARLHLDSEKGQNYLHDMELVLEYSLENRMEMMKRAIEVISKYINIEPSIERKSKNLINIPHNYARVEDHFGEKLLVHRKGATSVHKGEMGIIPGSMGTASYIVEGRGNPYSFMSCSHGAGRLYSRGDAFKRISNHAFKKSMEGIMTDTGKNKKDEAPAAYKNISEIMKYQKDSVKIVRKLKPVAVVKG